MNNWYEKCLPRIKEIRFSLKEVLKDFWARNDVKGIYIWGSYAKNISKPNFRIKNIDVIAETDFISEDLIAIQNSIISKNLSAEQLIKQGYSPFAVDFSKAFSSIKQFNINPWAISSDKKFLHFGAISVNKEESDEICKSAEKFANDVNNTTKKEILKSSEEIRENWYSSYKDYLHQYYQNMPSGWYQMEKIKIKDVLDEAIRL